jgi:ketosteroid isomerase-like protein
MLTKEFSRDFANKWINSWNSHNIEQILSHYTDDFEFLSPFICLTMNEPDGTLKGKDKIGAYWQKAFEKIPDLKFELINVFVGVSSITILYKAILGKVATEVLLFNNENKVFKSFAHYDDYDL